MGLPHDEDDAVYEHRLKEAERVGRFSRQLNEVGRPELASGEWDEVRRLLEALELARTHAVTPSEYSRLMCIADDRPYDPAEQAYNPTVTAMMIAKDLSDRGQELLAEGEHTTSRWLIEEARQWGCMALQRTFHKTEEDER